MKKINFQLLIFFIAACILCFLVVVIFTLPSFVQQLNLSDKSNIGGAIGGITAPVIGIGTAILLYLAFIKQVQSNNDQKIKNESDLIFLLMNQFNNEIQQFYHSVTIGEKIINYTGIEGLNKFIKNFQGYDFNNFEFTFRACFESNHILLLMRSYNLIEKRIKLSPLSDDIKDMFDDKLKNIYYSVLRFPLTGIIKILSKHEKMKDEVTDEIEIFIKDKPQAPWVTFGLKD